MKKENRNYSEKIDQLLRMILSNSLCNVTIYVGDAFNSCGDDKNFTVVTLHQDSQTDNGFISVVYPDGNRDIMAETVNECSISPISIQHCKIDDESCNETPMFECDGDDVITADDVFRAIGIGIEGYSSKDKRYRPVMIDLPTSGFFDPGTYLLSRRVERLIHDSNPKSKKVAKAIKAENDMLRRNVYAMTGGVRSIVCAVNEMIMHFSMLENEVSEMRAQLNPAKPEDAPKDEQNDQPAPTRSKKTGGSKAKSSKGSPKSGPKFVKADSDTPSATNNQEPATQETENTAGEK